MFITAAASLEIEAAASLISLVRSPNPYCDQFYSAATKTVGFNNIRTCQQIGLSYFKHIAPAGDIP